MKHVLDTTVFNRVLDGLFDLSSLPNAAGLVATLVQVRELDATKDESRRAALHQVFQEVAPDLEQAAFSFDTPGAGFDEGEWSSDPKIAELAKALKPHRNNWKDALIAGTALKNGYALATADQNLAEVAKSFGIEVFVAP